MILKLEDIYSLHPGKFMYSFNNNLIPSSLFRSILRTNQVNGYNTRSSNRFRITLCCTNIRTFSVFYQGPVFLNKLSACIRDALPYIRSNPELKTFFYLVTELIT